ncbi:MAG: hypothetical protein HYX67_10670 [Candidatus Melainabacteria bacterium]|nr:hypothetical protein [Candidatus Melainabacteria bacterium]
MIVPFLFTLGACVLAHISTPKPAQMSDLIPLEEKVRTFSLPNGVKAYIQENQSPANHGSFRVVFRKPSCDEVLYSFESELGSMESIENFFSYCSNEASTLLHDPSIFKENCSYSCSDLPSFRIACPREMAVIAVGDFPPEAMQAMIEKHFSEITLSGANASDPGNPIHVGFDGMISKVAMRVSFPNLRKGILTYEDLKEKWKLLLLQDLFQQRMERCSRGVEESWVHPHPRFFYPVDGYTLASQEISENLLSLLLWQIEAIRNEGFSEEEFCVAKRKLLNQIHYLASKARFADNVFLASYYTDQFLLGDNSLCYEVFLDSSAKLIEEIRLDAIIPYIDSFFAATQRSIQIVYPEAMHARGMTKDRIEEMIERIVSLASFYKESEIEEDSVWIFDTNSKNEPSLPPSLPIVLASNQADVPTLLVDNPAPIGNPYFQLPISEKEQRIIRTIITTMADKNIIQLALIKHTMEKKGKKITHVHPMRFAGYIFSNSDLRSSMKQVKKSSFKWDAFVDGFSKRMKEEYNNNNINKYIDGFSSQVGADPASVTRFIDKKDWEGLLKFLL